MILGGRGGGGQSSFNFSQEGLMHNFKRFPVKIYTQRFWGLQGGSIRLPLNVHNFKLFCVNLYRIWRGLKDIPTPKILRGLRSPNPGQKSF